MTMRPEQASALSYLRRKGTEAPAADLRKSLAGALGELEALLASIPPEERDRPPAAGGWSVQGVLDHLVASHEPAVAELGALVAGKRPAGGPIPAGLRSPYGVSPGWDELMDRLRRVHRHLLDLAEAGEGASLEVRAPVVLVIKAELEPGKPVPIEWIEELDWKAYVQALRVHTIEHMAQIRRTARQGQS